MIGQVLQETYRIEREIGRGSMGVVYEVAHLRLSRGFAVKVLTSRPSAEALLRFQREAEITSGLRHPHIVDVGDCTHVDDMPYIIMELLEGEDLATKLAREGPLPLSTAATIFMQTTSALVAAHRSNVIHRDLKPQNIFLCRWGERDDFVKVVDFGISKVLSAEPGLTKEHALVGTPCYMAPEQAEQRASDVDRRTDVYAMGAILYEMLGGTPPFWASSALALLMKIVQEEPRPLRSLRPEIPERVERVVSTALNKDPDHRHDSMQSFRRELGRAMEECQVSLLLPTSDVPALAPSPEPVPDRAPEPQWVTVAFEDTIVAPVAENIPGTEENIELPTNVVAPNQVEVELPTGTWGQPSGATTHPTRDWVEPSVIPRPMEDPVTIRIPRQPRRGGLVIALVAAAVAVGAVVGFLTVREDAPPLGPRHGGSGASPDMAMAVPPPVLASPDGPVLDLRPPTPDAAPPVDVELPDAEEDRIVRRPPRRNRRRPRRKKPVKPAPKSCLLKVGATVVADVYLDGKKIGQTPLVEKVTPGRHTLVLKTATGKTRRLQITLQPGKPKSLELDLDR